MRDRITQRDIGIICGCINKKTGSPSAQYTRTSDGKYNANIGCYYLSYAYGGVKLERISSSGGGCTDISQQGFDTKRKLYDWMRAFLDGLDAQTQEAAQ